MAITKMEADSTARAHKKQRRSDMRGAQHTAATQQPSSMINRRVPDKTHTRQSAPAHCGVRTGANGRHLRDPPPRDQLEPSGPRAHAPQRAAAPRAHPPPWAGSPGRFRDSPASPGDGSDDECGFPTVFIAVIFPRWRRSSPGIHSASTPKLFIFRTKVD